MSRPEPARTVTKLRPAAGGPDGGSEAAAACVVGVRSLGERPAKPPAFSDEALKRVRSLAGLTGGGAGMEIAGAARSGAPERAIVTSRTAANAAAALKRSGGGYEVYGSVEGPAEALDMRGAPYFTVRDAITGGAVRCYFGEREREREEVARAVAGKRIVSVDGILHRDRADRPRRINPVRSVAVIGEPLPGEWVSPAGLFDGIGDTQAYLRDIRGG